MKSHWLSSALLMLVFTWQVEAQGQTVYKVTDEEGRITYTDIPPEMDHSAEVITLLPTIGGNGTNGQSLIDQMAATADRLKEDRLQREAQREKQQASPPPVYGYPQAAEQETHHYWYPYREPYPYNDRWSRRDKRHDDWRNHDKQTNGKPRHYNPRNKNPRSDRDGTWHIPLKKPSLGVPDPLENRR